MSVDSNSWGVILRNEELAVIDAGIKFFVVEDVQHVAELLAHDVGGGKAVEGVDPHLQALWHHGGVHVCGVGLGR